MRGATVILSATRREAMQFARQQGLRPGDVLWPSTGAQIAGRKIAKIVELPSFSKAPNRHSVNARLRFLRGKIERVKADDFIESQTTIFEQDEARDQWLKQKAKEAIAADDGRRVPRSELRPGSGRPDEWMDDEPEFEWDKK